MREASSRLKEDSSLSISDVILAPGEISDIDFIGKISRDLFGVYGHYEEVVPNWFMSGMSLTITARLNEEPVGFAMIGVPENRYDQDNTSELLAIAVDPKYHRNGVGQLLLRDVDERAAGLGIRRLFLHTAMDNNNARSLFSKVGYRPWQIKRNFYPNGQDAVVMSKSIMDFGA